MRPSSRWSEVAAKGSPPSSQCRISKNIRKAANAIERLSTKRTTRSRPHPGGGGWRGRTTAPARRSPSKSQFEDRRPAEVAADDGQGRRRGGRGRRSRSRRATVTQDRQRSAVGDPGGSERRERKGDGPPCPCRGRTCASRRERRDRCRGGRAERQASSVVRLGVGLLHAARPQPAAPAKAAARSAATTAKEMLQSTSHDPPIRDDKDEQRPERFGAPKRTRRRSQAAACGRARSATGKPRRSSPGARPRNRDRSRPPPETARDRTVRAGFALGSDLAPQRPEEHGAEGDEHGAGGGRRHGRVAIGEPDEHQRHCGDWRPRGADKPGCRDEHVRAREAEEHPARRPVGICLLRRRCGDEDPQRGKRRRAPSATGDAPSPASCRFRRWRRGPRCSAPIAADSASRCQRRSRASLRAAPPAKESEHTTGQNLGLGRADEERARERGEEPSPPAPGSDGRRGQHRRDGDRAEEHERARGADHAVEGVRRVGRRERGRGPGRGQHPRDVDRGERGERRGPIASARPLAGRNERKREESAGGDACARASSPCSIK